MSNIVLEARDLGMSFSQGSERIDVLRQISFALQAGQAVAVVGQSGAGKSTLLHLLGGLDKPTSGEVFLSGQSLSRLGEAKRGRLRNQHLGFVYQFHHLLPEFTALENVAMPLLIAKVAIGDAMRRAAALLEHVGLGERLRHKPGELSGGERQRAAIARALINDPSCVMADEPTGNLDRQNAELVFDLMLAMKQRSGTSLVLVTHDRSLVDRMDSAWELRDGGLQPVH